MPRALDSWYACEEPGTLEEIAADYDLPVEAVKEGIAYCQSDPPELRQDYAREPSLMEATRMVEPGYKCRAAENAIARRVGQAGRQMRLYLDDDVASALLARLLRQGGHDLQVPGWTTP